MKTISTGKFIAKFYYIEKSTRLHRTNAMMQKPNPKTKITKNKKSNKTNSKNKPDTKAVF